MVLCQLYIAALLLYSRPSWGLSAVKAVTASPRGWHAAADAAWTRASTAALSSNQQRQRFRERGPTLVGGLSDAAVTAADEAAHAAEPAPAQPRPSKSPGAAAPKQSYGGRLPALPLLLLIVAAAFSAGYAVGRGQQARALAELRELASAELAAQQLASQAAQHVAKLQHTASAPVLEPAAGVPNGVGSSAGTDVTGADAGGQHADNASMLGVLLPEQEILAVGGHGATVCDDRSGDSQSGNHAAAPDAISGLSRSASAPHRLPHPVSGLVSLTDVVPGCESCLDRPGSGVSTSGSIGFPAAQTTVTALSSVLQAGEQQTEHSAEHAQQTEQPAQMQAEQDRPAMHRSEMTPASVVLRDGNHALAPRASAVEPPGSHPDQALSAPMRHLRSEQIAVDAIASADELARASSATEQVPFGPDCAAKPPCCCQLPATRHACWNDCHRLAQILIHHTVVLHLMRLHSSTFQSWPRNGRRGTRPQCWWAPWRGGCGWTWAACRRPTRSSSSVSSSPPGRRSSSNRSTVTRPGTLPLPMQRYDCLLGSRSWLVRAFLRRQGCIQQVGHNSQRASEGAHCCGPDRLEAEGSPAYCSSCEHHMLSVPA